MAKYLYIIIICLLFNGCISVKKMNKNEIKQITNGEAKSPFRILKTDNIQDSLLLRQKSVDIALDQLQETYLKILIERLKITMETESGIGIAAPQVGINRNLFLFTRVDQIDHPVQVAINPKIINHSENIICFEGDGCLSIPNKGGNSLRYEWIEVEFHNEKGVLIREKLSGYKRSTDFTGVIFQHEFDHLNGILFIDKLCDSDSFVKNKQTTRDN